MNPHRKRNTAPAPTPTALTLALRKRVEQLEIAREEAHILRDREALELIDKQITSAVKAWEQSFEVEVGSEEERVRKVG